MSNGNVRNVFTESGFISNRFSSRLDEQNQALNVLRTWQTEGLVLREERFYALQEC